MSENEFLSSIAAEISEALWSERELGKKEKILMAVEERISQRIIDTLPPGTVLMG